MELVIQDNLGVSHGLPEPGIFGVRRVEVVIHGVDIGRGIVGNIDAEGLVHGQAVRREVVQRSPGDVLGNGPALLAVGIEAGMGWRAVSLFDGEGEFPDQVLHVLDARVEAKRPPGGHQVSRIAGQENEATRRPVVRDDAGIKNPLADAENLKIHGRETQRQLQSREGLLPVEPVRIVRPSTEKEHPFLRLGHGRVRPQVV